MKNTQKDRKSIALFWIAAFLVVGLAALFSLVLSKENIPQPPKGQEMAAVHMASSLLSEGSIRLSGEETAALLFPSMKNALGEKLIGLNIRTDDNIAECFLGIEVSGHALGVSARAELLQREDAFGLRFDEIYVGKLPLPPEWALKKAEEDLRSFGKTEGNILWISRKLTVPVIEGRAAVPLFVQEISLDKEGVSAEISLADGLLSVLKEDWPF